MKKIVIGIDVSKDKIDATAIDVRDIQLGVVKLDYQVFDNRPMGFRRMLVWARHLIKGAGLEDMLFCCETTGGYDRRLCDYVYAKGLEIWRESAHQIKRSMGLHKGKDDKAAECAIKERGIYHDYYLRLKKEGKHYGIIVNNVRNKLIHLTYSLVTNDMDYEKNHEFLREKRNSDRSD